MSFRSLDNFGRGLFVLPFILSNFVNHFLISHYSLQQDFYYFLTVTAKDNDVSVLFIYLFIKAFVITFTY